MSLRPRITTGGNLAHTTKGRQETTAAPLPQRSAGAGAAGRVSGRGPVILFAAGRHAVGVRHSLTRPAQQVCTPSHRSASSSRPRTAERRHVRQYLLPDHPLPDVCTAGLGSLPPTRLHDRQQGPPDRGVRLQKRQLGTRKGVSRSGAAPPAARPGGAVPAGPPSGTWAAKPKNCDVAVLPRWLSCHTSKTSLHCC
jgi:hypothetical protein